MTKVQLCERRVLRVAAAWSKDGRYERELTKALYALQAAKKAARRELYKTLKNNPMIDCWCGKRHRKRWDHEGNRRITTAAEYWRKKRRQT